LDNLVRNATDNKPTQAASQRSDEFSGPRIIVIGCGGAGNNSVNRIARMGISGAELIACNTDKQHLALVHDSVRKILIGQSITRGLGAGGYPEVGAKAAENSRAALTQALDRADLVFLTAGMGGGTGTGAAPIISEIAKEQGAIVVAMVTFPFLLERARIKKAEEGIEALRKVSDTVIIIDNNRLVEIVPNLPVEQAFAVADEVIARAIRGITETITVPSLINLDYADVRAIMSGGGVSVISVGEARGHRRVDEVVEDTLKNALLDVDYSGAKGALIHISGGPDLTLGDANEIGEKLTEAIDPNAQVSWGARILPEYEGKVEVISIFTGVQSPHLRGTGSRDSESRGRKEKADIGIDSLL